MGFFSKLFKRKSSTDSSIDINTISHEAQRLVKIINESLKIANESKNPETKVSQLYVAKNNLSDIKQLSAQYSFITLVSFEEVESTISELENDLALAGDLDINENITGGFSKDRKDDSKTIREMQKLPISEWGNTNIIEGVKFTATLQLRCPLRILKHHNEFFQGDGPPPNYSKEPWEGFWLPKIKNQYEVITDPKMASDIGYIPSSGGEYLLFLIAIREIVETKEDVITRRNKLTIELKNPTWKQIVKKHGGTEKILNYFFPPFIETIPGLQKETLSELKSNNLFTPTAFMNQSDNLLLSIKGIGPAKLKIIRKHCLTVAEKSCKYIDLVNK